jgi:hypothetical protein
MAIDRKAGYPLRRPYYPVDENADIQAGMVAFLTTVAGVVTATVAASGSVPIGTFWKDAETAFYRTTLETGTFDGNDQVLLRNSPVRGTAYIKVTNSGGGTVYTNGTDYTVNLSNGIVNRVAGGSITAGQAVIVWYTYSITARDMQRFGYGSNYDRIPDDTTGSGKIAIVEGWAHVWTDQYDTRQTYTLNAPLRSNAASLWTTQATTYPVCGRVIGLPTVSNPYLGVAQIPVAQ